MNRMSKFLGFGAVAGFGLALALVLAPQGRAAVSTPSLHLSYSASDIEHAHKAFDGFRNSLDAAPRKSETEGQTAAIQGERNDCARYAWPHIPQHCQNSASGQHRRQIRTVAVDQPTR